MEHDLTSAEGRAAACKAILDALDGDDSPIAAHVRLLAAIIAADIEAGI